jgi:hypothetical protein
MSAAEALKAARAAGIELALDGDDLALSAASEPPAAVLDAVSRHKAQIVALLRPGRDGWSGEDWLAFFDERAGIAEFDGGLPRAEAEAQAFACCVVEWLNRHPACSPPGRCHGCGGREDTYDTLLPYGTEPTGQAWLHSRCWAAWHARRKAAAVAVLSLTLVTTGTNTMAETVTIGRPPVAKAAVSRRQSTKPATVSASALAQHFDCSRTSRPR